MKKLSLNASAFQKGEVLTRSQLKKVLGGDGSGIGGSGDTPCNDVDECTTSGGTCGKDEKGKCTIFGCGSGKYHKDVLYCIMP